MPFFSVDTLGIRSQLDGANEALADPNAQDNNALGILAGTIVSTEVTNAIGDYTLNNIEDGSVQKIGIHAINGILTNALTGGSSSDALGSATAAATVEAVMTHLKTGDEKLDQTIASLVGGVASKSTGGSFDSGAIAGGFADKFNRQLHEKEFNLIRANVGQYAKEKFGTEEPTEAQLEQARKELTAVALKATDSIFSDLEVTEEARAYLQNLAKEEGGTFNVDGKEYTLFESHGAEFNNATIFANEIFKNLDLINSAKDQAMLDGKIPLQQDLATKTISDISKQIGNWDGQNKKELIGFIENIYKTLDPNGKTIVASELDPNLGAGSELSPKGRAQLLTNLQQLFHQRKFKGIITNEDIANSPILSKVELGNTLDLSSLLNTVAGLNGLGKGGTVRATKNVAKTAAVTVKEAAGKVGVVGRKIVTQVKKNAQTPSPRVARREAMRRAGIPTSQTYQTQITRSRGDMMKGGMKETIYRDGEPVGAFEVHQDGHFYKDNNTYEKPHYHKDGHITYDKGKPRGTQTYKDEPVRN